MEYGFSVAIKSQLIAAMEKISKQMDIYIFIVPDENFTQAPFMICKQQPVTSISPAFLLDSSILVSAADQGRWSPWLSVACCFWYAEGKQYLVNSHVNIWSNCLFHISRNEQQLVVTLRVWEYQSCSEVWCWSLGEKLKEHNRCSLPTAPKLAGLH